MSVAYVDTSVLMAIAFDEPGAAALARRLDEFTRLVSSNLLEAELRAAFAREEGAFPEGAFAGIDWILPDRPLAPELAAALEAGYLWGADLWHAASAPYTPPLAPRACRSPPSTSAKARWRRPWASRSSGSRRVPERRNPSLRPPEEGLGRQTTERCRGRYRTEHWRMQHEEDKEAS